MCFCVWMPYVVTCLSLVMNSWMNEWLAWICMWVYALDGVPLDTETSVYNMSAGLLLTWSQRRRNEPDFTDVLSVWRCLSLGGNESMLHGHCSNSSPCVIAAKANSGLGERILPLNQQIVCVFTGSKGTFWELWKGRNLGSSSFQSNPLLVKP